MRSSGIPSISACMSPLCATGHADLADLAARELVVGVVAGLRRQVEGDREPGLPLGQVAAGRARWTAARSSGRRRSASSRAIRAFETVVSHAGIFAARAPHRRHAPRPRARHLLLGGRRRARRSRPAVRARTRCSRRSAASARARILLTHIHFDHAGAAGRAGAPLARPAGLRPRARRAAPGRPGAARRQRRAAVRRRGGARSACGARSCRCPEANLRVLEGGETGVEGAFTRRVHARPRLPPRLLPARADAAGAFVGDMAGVRVPPEPFTLAPTPPPDIDVEAWERSLDLDRRLGARGARAHALRPRRDPPEQLERVRASLHAPGRARRRARPRRLRRGLRRPRRTSGPARTADALLQAAPPDQLYLGLRPLAQTKSAAGILGPMSRDDRAPADRAGPAAGSAATGA